MPAVQGPPHDLSSIGVIVMMIGAACVLYWRMALRIAAILIITLAVYGAVLLIAGMRH